MANVYIWIDKATGDIEAYGSLSPIHKLKGESLSKFYTHFGRLEKTFYEGKDFILYKREIVSGGKSFINRSNKKKKVIQYLRK